MVSVIGLSVTMVVGLVALMVLLLCRPEKDEDNSSRYGGSRGGAKGGEGVGGAG